MKEIFQSWGALARKRSLLLGGWGERERSSSIQGGGNTTQEEIKIICSPREERGRVTVKVWVWEPNEIGSMSGPKEVLPYATTENG